MIIELFILLEILMFVTFFISFFTKQEIFWAVTAVLSGVLMVSSYNIQIVTQVLDTSLKVYIPTLTSISHPFMMGINLMFFALAIVLGLIDYFDKYSFSIFNFKK